MGVQYGILMNEANNLSLDDWGQLRVDSSQRETIKSCNLFNTASEICGEIFIQCGRAQSAFDSLKESLCDLTIISNANKALKKIQKKRANKTKLSHRKRKRVYTLNKPLKTEFKGSIMHINNTGEGAEMAFRVNDVN